MTKQADMSSDFGDRPTFISDDAMRLAVDRLRFLAGGALEECPYSIEVLVSELVHCLYQASTNDEAQR